LKETDLEREELVAQQVCIGSQIFEADGLFFDKDGPLVDFRYQYTKLMDKRIELILSKFPKNKLKLHRAICRSIGYDARAGLIDPRSPFAMATRGETLTIVAHALYRHGAPWDQASSIVAQAFLDADQQIKLEDLIRPTDGLSSILSAFQKSGLILACLTNDDGKRARAILDFLEISSYFKLIIGGDEVTRPKPDPEIFQKACQQLSLNPQRVAFFGDTVSDMMMAKKAGAGLAVGVLTGGTSTKFLLKEAAHIVIDSLRNVSILHNPRSA